jgi:hypothetical protein
MDRLMERRWSRSSAVSRRDRRLRAAFRDSQKRAYLTLESVVLSGFPTTVEPSFPYRLPPGATLPWVRKRSQETWPREDIPPPLAFTLRSLPPPPGPDLDSSYPSFSFKGAVWAGWKELFRGGIKKSIVQAGESGVMCDPPLMKSGKKRAAGRGHVLPTLPKLPI